MAWLTVDFVSPAVSGLLSPVLSLLYRVMEKTVALASRAPGISIRTPWPAIILSAAISLFVLWFYSRRRAAGSRLRGFDARYAG
jgi:hypothetical protein